MVKMPHWPTPMERASMKLGLDNIGEFLEKLGNPHHHIPPVIHVAGTNGKGSTIAFMRAILEAYGLKVHVYTSPHLLEYNERIVLAGEKISDQFLHQLLEECRLTSLKHELSVSFFEGTTAAAFLAFSRVKADIVLLEVGLGGRLDATNIITKPLLTVITPISFDHMDMLGDTIEQIAFEKANIMKSGVPCVVSMQSDEAHHVIAQYASKIDVPICRYEYDFGLSYQRGIISYHAEDYTLTMPQLALNGDHQYINAATAIAAIKSLKLNITDNMIVEGLSTAKWPGRLQLITNGNIVKSLPNNWELWLDGAHNAAGMLCVANWLQDKLTAPVYAIVGFTKKRPIKQLLGPLQNLVSEIIAVNVKSEPLSYPAEHIAAQANEMGFASMACQDIEEALDYVSQKNHRVATIIVTGSLFLVADALAIT